MDIDPKVSSESEEQKQKFLEDGKTEVEEISEEVVYELDEKAYAQLMRDELWKNDPMYFKKVKISSLAVLKMTMHANAGGRQEIMGIMVGRVIGNTCLIVDTYPLPIVGTETRVTDISSDPVVGEYMYYNLVTAAEKLGRKEKLIGWYHSHPGFGCWLSKVDCGTQQSLQRSGGHVAVVVDPYQTKASGRVALGAFRCYPDNYKPASATPSGQVIPKEKMLEFGSCADLYYKLEVDYFKTSFQQKMFDKLWSQFWAQTLSSSPLVENSSYTAAEIEDLTGKFIDHISKNGNGSALTSMNEQSSKIATEAVNNLISQVLKDSLFNKIEV